MPLALTCSSNFFTHFARSLARSIPRAQLLLDAPTFDLRENDPQDGRCSAVWTAVRLETEPPDKPLGIVRTLLQRGVSATGRAHNVPAVVMAVCVTRSSAWRLPAYLWRCGVVA